MSKMSDMVQTIEELRSAAATITDAANWLAQQFSGDAEEAPITALIGTNESGKTDIMLPLWKLNPAVEEHIDLQEDDVRTNCELYPCSQNRCGA